MTENTNQKQCYHIYFNATLITIIKPSICRAFSILFKLFEYFIQFFYSACKSKFAPPKYKLPEIPPFKGQNVVVHNLYNKLVATVNQTTVGYDIKILL